MVTLFDNDTEGIYTKELLLKELTKSSIDLKKKFNCIKILSYPDIDFFKKYPVFITKEQSVNKIEYDNVNKRAASIELYLPRKFLTDPNTGNLFPIRWQTYNESVNKYQGSFQRKIKEEIHENFRKETTTINENITSFNRNEWSNCDLIIRMLIKKLEIKEV